MLLDEFMSKSETSTSRSSESSIECGGRGTPSLLLAALSLALFGTSCAARSQYLGAMERSDRGDACAAMRLAKGNFEAYPRAERSRLLYYQSCIECYDHQLDKEVLDELEEGPRTIARASGLLERSNELDDRIQGTAFEVSMELFRDDERRALAKESVEALRDVKAKSASLRIEVARVHRAMGVQYVELRKQALGSLGSQDLEAVGQHLEELQALGPKVSFTGQLARTIEVPGLLEAKQPRSALAILDVEQDWHSEVAAVLGGWRAQADKLVAKGEAEVASAARYLERGDTGKARARLEKAVGHDSENPQLEAHASYASHLDQAHEAAAEGRVKDAAQACAEAEKVLEGLSYAGRYRERTLRAAIGAGMNAARKAASSDDIGQAFVELVGVLELDADNQGAKALGEALLQKTVETDRLRVGLNLLSSEDPQANVLLAEVVDAALDDRKLQNLRIRNVTGLTAGADPTWDDEAKATLSGHFDVLVNIDVLSTFAMSDHHPRGIREEQYVARMVRKTIRNPQWDAYQKALAEEAGNSVGGATAGFIANSGGGALLSTLGGLAAASAVENAVEPPKTIVVEEPEYGLCRYEVNACYAMANVKAQVAMLDLGSGAEIARVLVDEDEKVEDSGVVTLSGDCEKARVSDNECRVASEYDLLDEGIQKGAQVVTKFLAESLCPIKLAMVQAERSDKSGDAGARGNALVRAMAHARARENADAVDSCLALLFGGDEEQASGVARAAFFSADP